VTGELIHLTRSSTNNSAFFNVCVFFTAFSSPEFHFLNQADCCIIYHTQKPVSLYLALIFGTQNFAHAAKRKGSHHHFLCSLDQKKLSLPSILLTAKNLTTYSKNLSDATK
jgi:hypothetical protein